MLILYAMLYANIWIRKYEYPQFKASFFSHAQLNKGWKYCRKCLKYLIILKKTITKFKRLLWDLPAVFLQWVPAEPGSHRTVSADDLSGYNKITQCLGVILVLRKHGLRASSPYTWILITRRAWQNKPLRSHLQAAVWGHSNEPDPLRLHQAGSATSKSIHPGMNSEGGYNAAIFILMNPLVSKREGGGGGELCL